MLPFSRFDRVPKGKVSCSTGRKVRQLLAPGVIFERLEHRGGGVLNG